MRVGLTGGIGSGKSEVARILQEFGAFVIDADDLARDAVAPGSEGLRAIERAWPNVVRNGALDRAKMAQIVFADPQARERLNEIVHPRVRKLGARQEAAASPGQLVVHVVPLLFETGFAAMVDRTILVTAPLDVRIARVMARDGSDEEHVRARIAAQIDPATARERADYVIENDGNLEHLRSRTRTVYEALT
ncbi:MAG TPA: dephospho-CoA kinase [Candidatus Aquilonibacter sp.]